MVNITINGMSASVPEGTTILDAAASVGVKIPSLCYLRKINEIGACRVCCVEIEGEGKLVPSCNNKVREGMVIHTNTQRVREARRTNVELILSQHDSKCASCVRSGTCQLQALANDLGIFKIPYPDNFARGKKTLWTTTFPLYRNQNKCIKCMRCVQVCDKMQSVSVWDVSGSGSRTTIDVSGNRVIKEADCVLCGQCITHCPTGALRERDDTEKLFEMIDDPDLITVVQVAPAVRTAWAESMKISPEIATVKRMVAALRQLGVNYVFDTTFSADLTIMEEATEFLQRFRNDELRLQPMFTSCCPGWVRFLKSQFPQLTDCLSTAKSPQQMFGSITKSWFAQKIGVDPSKIRCISIMPCLAKKAESSLPTMRTEAGADVDLVLTTRELSRILRAENIVVPHLPEAEFDSPLGTATGAGVIFGTTGGVMEAALRTAYYMATGEQAPIDAFQNVRGFSAGHHGWRHAELTLCGATIRCAVVNGLGNARRLLQAILHGEVHYDFVEVMACPGGCVGGGGQPIDGSDTEYATERGKILYQLDEKADIRYSHENPVIQTLYTEYLETPCSEKAEALLHTNHHGWKMPSENHPVSS